MFTIILEHDELIIWTQDGKKIKILVFLTVVDKSQRSLGDEKRYR